MNHRVRPALILVSLLIMTATPSFGAGKPAVRPIDIVVRSSRQVPLIDVLETIQRARKKGEDWVADPISIALRVSGLCPAPVERTESVDLAIGADTSKMPKEFRTVLLEQHLEDDSIGAIWHQFVFSRLEGQWMLLEYRRAQQCRRGEAPGEFVATPCP